MNTDGHVSMMRDGVSILSADSYEEMCSAVLQALLAQKAMEAIRRDYEHVKANGPNVLAACRVCGNWEDYPHEDDCAYLAWEKAQ